MKTLDFAWKKGNTSPRIVELLHSLPGDDEVLIRFEKGIYDFRKEGAFTSSRSVSALHAELRTFVFLLENKKNITIDGGGSEFIFQDRVSPFALFDCENITLCNLVIDFSFPRYCQGDVLASDESGFELKIDETLFKIEVDSEGHAIFFSGDLPFSTGDYTAILLGNAIFGKPPWDYIFAGNSPNPKQNLPTGYIETEAVKTACGIRFNYCPGSRRLLFDLNDTLIFCYEPRNNVNILSQGCRNVRLENVTMYRGGGMGVIVTDTENFTAKHCVLQVRPGRKECRSTTADGFFFTQCTGNITIEDSAIQNTLDDAMNLHGLYTQIASIEAPDKIKVNLLFQYEGLIPFRKGDQITICGKKSHRRKYTGKLLDCTTLPGGSFLLHLDQPADSLLPGDQVENDTRSCNLIFRNNYVSQCPHLRVSDNGYREITGNHFEEIAGVLVNDLFEYWLESGAVDHLKIEKNTFTRCPRFGETNAIMVETTRNADTDVRHRNVSICNNRFENCGNKIIAVSTVDGLTIRKNLFISCDPGRLGIVNCNDVHREKNECCRKEEKKI